MAGNAEEEIMSKDNDMNAERHAHAEGIARMFAREMTAKYCRGQAEHSGNLWDKPQANNMMEEAVDQVTYAATLRQQHALMFNAASAGNMKELKEMVLQFCQA